MSGPSTKHCAPVGLPKYRGYTLLWYGEELPRGRYENYAVLDPWGGTLDLDVSRWNFTPSAARFRWLVDNAFPRRSDFGMTGPLTDTFIDTMIGRRAAA